MMINDQERRAVAKRLRALDVHEWYDGMDEVDSLEEAIECSISQDWQDMVWWHRLADLIDRPTCEAEQDYDYMEDGVPDCRVWVCHGCGDRFAVLRGANPCYCPSCGAEVVG